MNFALFRGCKIPYYASHYETATKAVLGKFGVTLSEMEFGCCGYPVRNRDMMSWLVSAAKNLALAEQADLDIMTPCKCCFGSLRKAAHVLDQDADLKAKVNQELSAEGLTYKGGKQVRHLLQVLRHDVGLEAVKEAVSRPFQKKLQVAVHYGCHALRPSEITQFDEDPANPSIFDDLVKVTGATSVDWSKKVECCGNPLQGIDDALSRKITAGKIKSGLTAGASVICSACTYCQIQFDSVQKQMLTDTPGMQSLPSVLYPQLLGLAMGLPEDQLGLDQGELKVGWLGNLLS